MWRMTIRMCLLMLAMSHCVPLHVCGQGGVPSASDAYTQELEKRIEALEQTVRALQQHLHTTATPASSQPTEGAAPTPDPSMERATQSSGASGQTSVIDPPLNRNVRVSGYTFGDYYAVGGHHDPDLEGRNGFWIRRAYLTFDKHLSETVDARLRFEMNSDGDFTTRDKLRPFVKDAYVRWSYSGDHQTIVGISPSPTKEVVEQFWGYRSVEKTLLDLQRLGSSREFGVAFRGNMDSERKLRYHFMVGNGSGNSSDTNAGKKALFSLAYYPSDSVIFELYSDYENRPDNAHRRTWQGFLGYQRDWGRLGIHYAHQTRNGSPDLGLDALSVFGVYHLSSRASLIGRYDRMFDPNPDGARIAFLPFDPTASSNLFLAGVDLKVSDEFSLIPNIEVVRYDEITGGTRPGTDMIPRLTFYYRY